MATISNLVVEISAKTAKFRNNIKNAIKILRGIPKKVREVIAANDKMAKKSTKAAKKIEDNNKKIGKSFSLITVGIGLVSTALAALSGKALVNFIDKNTRSIKELQTWSKTLNVGVNDIQKFAFAVKSVGFEMDKVTDILKDVNDKVGDALVGGGGEFANLLEDLKINIDRFQGLNPQEVLLELARATENLNAQKRVFIFEALANDASKLLPLLKNNGAELKKMSKDFEEFGLKFTQQQVNNAAQFQKNMGTMSALWRGFTEMLSAELAPAFEPLFKFVQDYIKEAGGMQVITQRIAKAAVQLGISFLDGIDKAQKTLRIFIVLLGDALNRFGSFFATIVRGILKGLDMIPLVDLSGPIKKLDDAINVMNWRLGQTAKRVKEIGKEEALFGGATKSLQEFKNRIGATKEYANAVERVTDTERALTKSEKKRQKELEKERKKALKEQKKKNSLLQKARDLYAQINQKAMGLNQTEQGGGLIAQLQSAAQKASGFVSTAAGERNRQLFKAGLKFLETGGAGDKKGGEVLIKITTDDKGIIKPVVESKELTEKIKVVVDGQARQQARINDR